jgi:hypothetical protein
MRTLVPFLAVFLLISVADIGERGLTTTTAIAKKKKKKKRSRKPKAPPAAPAPAPAPDPAPAVAPAKVEEIAAKPAVAARSNDVSTADLLAKANSLYDALEYEQVIPVTESVLARDDADIDMRLDAYLLQGSSLAIVGDPIEAEKPFRFLLRGRPSYDMPAETAPKILAVFRKVQVEERSIVTQMRELERARIVRELNIDPDVPEDATGGLPLEFNLKLRDPGRAVDSMSLHYRRGTEQQFSALALQLDDTGVWHGELPGEWTENDDGFDFQYYVSTADANGHELLTVGGATSPLNIAVAPGSVADARPVYKTWWFWTAAGVVAAAAGVGGYLLYDKATELPETDGRIDLSE